jgi:hypothetical protein
MVRAANGRPVLALLPAPAVVAGLYGMAGPIHPAGRPAGAR